jgi:hypothetical protein
MRNASRIVLAAALPVLVACATATTEDGSPRPRPNVITRAELIQANVNNAYEAVERLRPRWLRVRSMRSFSIETEIVVFQDEQMFLGNQDALERIGIDGIFEMRWLDGPTAQAVLPGIADRHIQGAIVVYMSPPDNPPDS